MDKIKISKYWIPGQPVNVDNLSGTAFTGEAQAHVFEIKGRDAETKETVPITGTITGKFLASNHVTIPLTGIVSDGVATLTLTEDCYAAPGRFVISIYATNGTSVTCIYAAVGNVFRTSSNVVGYPTATIPDLTQLITRVETAINSFPADYSALNAAVAPTFSTSTNYTAGQFVWQNGSLWRFTADHPAGDWITTDNVAASVGKDLTTEVSDLKSALSEVGEYSGLFREYDYVDATSGYYIDVNGADVTSASFSVSGPIAVAKGETVVAHGRGYLQSVAMIARYNGATGTYTSLVPSIDSTVRTYTYTATDDITIVLSYRTENDHSCKIYTDLSAAIETLETAVDEKQDTLTFDSVPTNGSTNPVTSDGVFDADEAIRDDIGDLQNEFDKVGENTGLFREFDFAGSVSGYYVGTDNALQTSSSFSVSAPITLSKGDVIEFFARGYLQSVAMVAQYKSETNTYKSLVPSIDSTERMYTYTATSNITVVLSYRTENTHTATIYANVISIADAVNSEINTIEKTGAIIEIKVKGGKFGYQFIKKTDSSKNLNTWLINKTSANGVDLQVTSDIEGPMQLNGNGGVEVDFIGGLHGDEQFTAATFILDGTIMDPAKDWARTEFTNFTVFVTSNVYHAESSDIAFVRYKKLDFTGNVLTITNRWVCADSNGVNIVTATGCGIYSIDESKMTGYSTNYNNVFVSEQATDPNPKINQVQFLGANYKIQIKALEGFNLENSKGRVVRLSSASSTTGYRDKVYLYAWYAATAYHLAESEDMLMSFSITCE